MSVRSLARAPLCPPALLGLLLLVHGMAAAQQPGLLVNAVVVEGDTLARPGDVVSFQDVRGGSELWLGDRHLVAELVTAIPLDEILVPAHAYLRALAWSPSALAAGEDVIRILSAALELYPDSRLAGLMAAERCRLTYEMELDVTWGKSGLPQARACVRDALAPPGPGSGAGRDQLEWLDLKLRTSVYEYEGRAEPVTEVAATYEAFLEAHPDHPYRQRATFELAHTAWIAYEILGVVGDPDTGLDPERAATFRRRAEALYEELWTGADDPALAARAGEHLAALRRGVRVYVDGVPWLHR